MRRASKTQTKLMDTISAWNKNAEFWDSKMGEGNDFHLKLIAPATLELLGSIKGKRILDIACGNGQFSRQLSKMGANVLAFDGSKKLIEIAKNKSKGLKIYFKVLDATSQKAIEAFGNNSFDAAVSNMALMDIADIKPIFRGLKNVLKQNAPFVFSLLHPCFHKSRTATGIEIIEDSGQLKEIRYLKIDSYLSEEVYQGKGMDGQPEKHHYFHRPLNVLFKQIVDAGFTITGLKEPAFDKKEMPKELPLRWQHFAGSIFLRYRQH